MGGGRGKVSTIEPWRKSVSNGKFGGSLRRQMQNSKRKSPILPQSLGDRKDRDVLDGRKFGEKAARDEYRGAVSLIVRQRHPTQDGINEIEGKIRGSARCEGPGIRAARRTAPMGKGKITPSILAEC